MKEGEQMKLIHTLSVSIVATSSSCATKSPTFFCHCLRVPSEIDSAIIGTLTVSSVEWCRLVGRSGERMRARNEPCNSLVE